MRDFLVLPIDFYIIDCVDKGNSVKFHDLVTCVLNNQHKTIVLTWFWESVNYDNSEPYLRKLLVKLAEVHKNIIFILDNWYNKWNLQLPIKKENVFYVDFCLLLSYIPLECMKLSKKQSKWNSDAKKFLFLPGKPARNPRTRLLYQLYQKNLLQYCNYSYHIPSIEVEKGCLSQLPEVPLSEWKTFYHHVNFTTFDKDIVPGKGWVSSKQAFLFDADKLYSNSLFAINVETMFDRLYSHPWPTEKTWLKIANKIPFISVAEFQTCKYLNSLGIKTFNEYMPIENYDDPELSNFLFDKVNNNFIFNTIDEELLIEVYNIIKDDTWPLCKSINDFKNLSNDIKNEVFDNTQPPIKDWNEYRIQAIIRNIEYWLDNLQKYTEDVEQDLDHNFMVYKNLGKEETEKIIKFLDYHNIKLTPDLVYLKILEYDNLDTKEDYEKN